MSLGPFTAWGGPRGKTEPNPRRSPARPWYSPTQWFAADTRSKGPARCACDQVSPRSADSLNHTSVMTVASPGWSLRRSYHITPTVPLPSTAIAGSNAKAEPPGRSRLVHVRPPSVERDTDTAPVVVEVLASDATYTVPSGPTAT